MTIRLLSSVGALVLVAALSACAPEPAAENPAPVPAVEPSKTPDAPDPVEVPQKAVDLACDDAIDTATREGLLQGAATLVAPDFERRELRIAERQLGGFTCWWEFTRADGGANRLQFTLIPNAATEFAAALEHADYGDIWTYDEFGDGSEFACSRGMCQFQILVGDVWISGEVARVADLDRGQVAAALNQLVASVAAAPRSSSTWQPPAGALVGWGRDCWPSDGPEAPILLTLRTVYGSPEMGSMGMEGDPRYLSLRAVNTLSYCNAAGEDYAVTAYAAVVTGGGWATEPGAASEIIGTDFTTVEVPGATRALVRCAEHCAGFASAGGSLVVLTSGTEDVASFTARLREVVATALKG